MNFSESSTLGRAFEREGYTRLEGTQGLDMAGVVVVNTCSVTADADKKCRNLIRRIHRKNPMARIVVTGCYARLKPDEVAAIDGVWKVVTDKERLVSEIIQHSTFSIQHFFPAYSSTERRKSYLKVQDGCDYKCSYCTIHRARGESRNLPIADVVAQAHEIVSSGGREIIVTGVNTGDFGRTTGERFVDLLRALGDVEGLERITISSIEPNLLTDEIIELCAANPKFGHEFHIPLQSGSDRVLGLMRRRYTSSQYADKIARVRRAMPEAVIGVDVIVGFPGETEGDFESTYALLARLRPSYLHVFPYSARANTPAAAMDDQVAPEVKMERVKKLLELDKELRSATAG